MTIGELEKERYGPSPGEDLRIRLENSFVEVDEPTRY